jgi:DNA-binding MarR family transcriptional regulator
VPDAGPAEIMPAVPGAASTRRDHALIEQALSAIVADIGALELPVGRSGGDPVSAGDPAVTIARQVADMAQGLAALADRLVGQAAVPADHGISEGDCIAFLETQFRIRRLRSRHLPGLALGEPAWDMLLDLSVAHYWRRETSVTSLCIAADVPSTTALRWINSMTKAGLIVRRPCQRDGRRSFLAISPGSYAAMLALAADALRTEQRVRSRYQRRSAA